MVTMNKPNNLEELFKQIAAEDNRNWVRHINTTVDAAFKAMTKEIQQELMRGKRTKKP